MTQSFDPVPNQNSLAPNRDAGDQPPKPDPFRSVTPQEIQEILKEHRRWIESDGAEGKKADLSSTVFPEGINLEGQVLIKANLVSAILDSPILAKASLNRADLRNAQIYRGDFSCARLHDANLSYAYLRSTSFQGAFLVRSNLLGANLSEVDMRDAVLQDADLRETKGLVAGQLGGANVSGAKLPEDISKFEGLAHVEEIAKKAGKLFVTMLLGCVYSWLTIATTTDARLLTNSVSSPLPIIQTTVPIAAFYWAAPVILLAIYLWFHLYLQEMWKGLASLPAVFPDGRPLDQKAHPWLLTGLVRPHFKLLRQDRPPLSRIKVGISIILAWWVVPLTILFFWARYLPKHDWVGTSVHIGELSVSIVTALALFRLAVSTLSGNTPQLYTWARSFKLMGNYANGALLVGIFAFFYFVSDKAMTIGFQGPKAVSSSYATSPKYSRPVDVRIGARTFLPQLLAWLGTAILVDAELSVKPTNWDGKRIDLIKGAQLYNTDLRHALANGAFLAKADLTKAILHRASLREADLRGARLALADLYFAQLSGADLMGADLSGARLHATLLDDSNLEGAKLREANLYGALLSGANLKNADLEDANLEYAGLEDPWYFSVKNKELIKDEAYRSFLETQMSKHTSLEGVNFKGANLRRTRLQGLDLRKVIGLTQKQINHACLDENTKLKVGLTSPAPCPSPISPGSP